MKRNAMKRNVPKWNGTRTVCVKLQLWSAHFFMLIAPHWLLCIDRSVSTTLHWSLCINCSALTALHRLPLIAVARTTPQFYYATRRLLPTLMLTGLLRFYVRTLRLHSPLFDSTPGQAVPHALSNVPAPFPSRRFEFAHLVHRILLDREGNGITR